MGDRVNYIIIFGLVYLAFSFVAKKCIRKWEKKKPLEGGHRFSKIEEQFIEKAQANLRHFARDNTKVKSGFGLLQWLGPVSFFVPIVTVMYLIYVAILELANKNGNAALESGMAGYFINTDVGVSALIGVFAGIMLASFLIYYVSGYLREFWEWLALNHDEFDKNPTPESILTKRLALIEHDVRIGRLDPLDIFSPRQFLRGMVARHMKYVGRAAFFMLSLTCIFLVLDLREQSIFYKDHATVNNYWTGHHDISYANITQINVQCTVHEGDVSLSLELMVGEKNVERIYFSGHKILIDTKNFDGVDDALRTYNIPYVKRVNKKGESRYTNACIKALEANYYPSETKRLRKIIHAGEISDG